MNAKETRLPMVAATSSVVPITPIPNYTRTLEKVIHAILLGSKHICHNFVTTRFFHQDIV